MAAGQEPILGARLIEGEPAMAAYAAEPSVEVVSSAARTIVATALAKCARRQARTSKDTATPVALATMVEA